MATKSMTVILVLIVSTGLTISTGGTTGNSGLGELSTTLEEGGTDLASCSQLDDHDEGPIARTNASPYRPSYPTPPCPELR